MEMKFLQNFPLLIWAALIPCMVLGDDKLAPQQQTNQTNKVMRIREIIAVAGQHARGMPIETRVTRPIPVISDTGLKIILLYYRGVIRPGEGTVISPPLLKMTLNANSGAFESLVESPKELEPPTNAPIPDPPNLIKPGPEVTWQELAVEQQKLLDLYDVLLPGFAANAISPEPQQQRAAEEFNRLFDRLAEPPLRWYYLKTGSGFFSWVNRAAGKR